MKDWLTSAGTFPVEKIPCPHPSGGVDLSKPPVGLMHTTEGSWDSALNEFRSRFAPTFLLGRDNRGKVRIAQLVPLGEMTAALKNASGGVETNRWTRAQIELVGFSKQSPWLPDPEVLEALASLMATLAREADIPLRRPFVDEMPPTPWAFEGFSRRHAGKWGREAGWFGHVEVPENDHWDPGALRWSDLLSKARTILNEGSETDLTLAEIKELELAAEKYAATGETPGPLSEQKRLVFWALARAQTSGVSTEVSALKDRLAKIAALAS